MRVLVNLGPHSRDEDGHSLARYGFHVSAPGLVAANVRRVGTRDFGEEGIAYVSEGTAERSEVWLYATAEQEAAVELPQGMGSSVAVAMDGISQTNATAENGTLSVLLQGRPGHPRMQPPPELAGMAPQDWPGRRPGIAILNMPGLPASWTRITAADWLQAFTQSRLAVEFGVPIYPLTNVVDLVAALSAGSTHCLAIIYPCGEIFPASGSNQWQNMLNLVRGYVNQGGSWWETAGYSFYIAESPQGSGWQSEVIGASGANSIGIPVGDDPVDQPAELLTVTATGRQLLGDVLADRIQELASSVNRGLPRTPEDPGHTALIAGSQQDFLGAYRLEGWGYLWRIGGFFPNPGVALPAAVAAMEYVFTHPPLRVEGGPAKYLWHGIVTRLDRPAL